MGSILNNALVISLVLPLIQVAGFGYVWRAAITSPWWFVSTGLVGMYIIMAVCISSTFSDIGLTGAAASPSADAANSLAIHYIGVTVIGVIVAAGMLWALRKFFGN